MSASSYFSFRNAKYEQITVCTYLLTCLHSVWISWLFYLWHSKHMCCRMPPGGKIMQCHHSLLKGVSYVSLLLCYQP